MFAYPSMFVFENVRSNRTRCQSPNKLSIASSVFDCLQLLTLQILCSSECAGQHIKDKAKPTHK